MELTQHATQRVQPPKSLILVGAVRFELTTTGTHAGIHFRIINALEVKWPK